jgi:hypothetical protein
MYSFFRKLWQKFSVPAKDQKIRQHVPMKLITADCYLTASRSTISITGSFASKVDAFAINAAAIGPFK